jgi:uncharacterized cupin superfamily protein
MTSKTTIWSANLDSEEFEPYIENGETLGEVKWIRQEFDSAGAPRLLVGIMRIQEGAAPDAFEYDWVTDETIQILEGQLIVEVRDGDTITMRPGDVASFPKGATAVFRPTAPYKQFFVMTDSVAR